MIQNKILHVKIQVIIEDSLFVHTQACGLLKCFEFLHNFKKNNFTSKYIFILFVDILEITLQFNSIVNYN